MRSDAEYRDMKKKYGFRHSKSLRQNFLKDKNIITEIISGSNIRPEDLVIEIGPGAGVLTRPAAAAAKKVLAVEIDRRLIPILTDTVNGYQAFCGGTGSFEIPDYNGFRLPFGRATLRRKSISPDNVFCCTLTGDSMEERIAEDAAIAVDAGEKTIRDGKI